MAGPHVATIRGRLQLVIADGDPIDMGSIEIPITAQPTTTGAAGELILSAKPNMREVREFVEVVFGNADYQHKNHEEN